MIKIVVAITGASGSIYAIRFLQRAAEHFDEVLLTVSEQALQVMRTETELKPTRENLSDLLGGPLRLLDERDYFTPPASGSFRHEGMVIVPCSMGTLGRVANGISNDLTTRAADVCLKEGRKLIMVVREMPYNLVMLRNMVSAAEAGATILPASPAWYNRPANLDELADTVVARILQNLGVVQKIVPEWAVDE
ncbi:MAG: UbiX family flavin prenyltransferase [Armatimonadota bacterium]|nr:UbiX family flavin prenyltransferase [Armatimonadota bacterium]